MSNERRTSSRINAGGNGGGGNRGGGSDGRRGAGARGRGAGSKPRTRGRPRGRKTNANDAELLARLAPPQNYVPTPYTTIPPQGVPDTQHSTIGHQEPSQPNDLASYPQASQMQPQTFVPSMMMHPQHTDPDYYQPRLPDASSQPPSALYDSNMAQWGQPSGTFSGGYDDEVDDDREWNTGFQSEELYGVSPWNNLQETRGPSMPLSGNLLPSNTVYNPHETPQQSDNFSQLPPPQDNSGSVMTLPSAPQTQLSSSESRLTPFFGSRLPHLNANPPAAASSTTEQETHRRLNAPLHRSSETVDTLGVSRSRRSSTKIASPYELNLRSSNSRSRPPSTVRSSKSKSQPSSMANSPSVNSTAFLQGLLASVSNSQASDQGGPLRLDADDSKNVKLATKYHIADILSVDGWPLNTEAKDNYVEEALSQANVEAGVLGRPATEMTRHILSKLRHISSNIRGGLKADAEDDVPNIFGLLPSAKDAQFMTLQQQAEFTRERVKFLQNNMACFNDGRDVKGIQLFWNNAQFHLFLVKLFYTNKNGPARKHHALFCVAFPLVAMALGATMVMVVLSEYENGYFVKRGLDEADDKDRGTYVWCIGDLKKLSMDGKFYRRLLKEYRVSIAARGMEHMKTPSSSAALHNSMRSDRRRSIEPDAARNLSDRSDDDMYTDYGSD